MGVLEFEDVCAEGGGIREIWGEGERVYVHTRGECRDDQLCRTSKRGQRRDWCRRVIRWRGKPRY